MHRSFFDARCWKSSKVSLSRFSLFSLYTSTIYPRKLRGDDLKLPTVGGISSSEVCFNPRHYAGKTSVSCGTAMIYANLPTFVPRIRVMSALSGSLANQTAEKPRFLGLTS